jgi:hypothetical protein
MLSRVGPVALFIESVLWTARRSPRRERPFDLHGMLLVGLVEIIIPDGIIEAFENVVGEE